TCFSEGLGKIRVLKYLRMLSRLAEKFFEKDFEDANRKDIEKILAKIEASELAAWTKRDYRVALKKFYRFLRGTDEYPPEVSWIKTSIRNSKHLLPEGLLLEEDIEKLIRAALSARDKAFIAVLYESGARVGEILGMSIGQIEFLDVGAALMIHGKTGSRRIRIVSSVPYLAAWVNAHPNKGDKNAPLWVNMNYKGGGKLAHYAVIRKMLKATAARAGLKKKVNPHHFRHSRATYLATKWTDAQMKAYLGWEQSSDMPGTYVHLSGRNMDDAVLSLYNFNKKEEEKSRLEPKKCARCGLLNESTNERCSGCAAPLSLEAAALLVQKMDAEEKLHKLQAEFLGWWASPEGKEFRERMNKKLSE
ncbi:MAG: tyrosine-type recombinase/integrase, partial [Candidatus Micrarchaeota archaeon]